jgi:hypothetical protein
MSTPFLTSHGMLAESHRQSSTIKGDVASMLSIPFLTSQPISSRTFSTATDTRSWHALRAKNMKSA